MIKWFFDIYKRHRVDARIYQKGKIFIRIWYVILSIGLLLAALQTTYAAITFFKSNEEFILKILFIFVPVILIFAGFDYSVFLTFAGFRMATRGILFQNPDEANKEPTRRYIIFDIIIGILNIVLMVLYIVLEIITIINALQVLGS